MPRYVAEVELGELGSGWLIDAEQILLARNDKGGNVFLAPYKLSLFDFRVLESLRMRLATKGETQEYLDRELVRAEEILDNPPPEPVSPPNPFRVAPKLGE